MRSGRSRSCRTPTPIPSMSIPNFDPGLRSQEKAVEYFRALNATKLDKIFARPFVGAMDGHIDAVSCMAKNPIHLKGIFSGSMDGDIRVWDIASRRTVYQFPGLQGAFED